MGFTSNKRLDRLERMIAAIHPKLNSLLRAANLTIDLGLENMADFTSLNAKVSKLTSIAESEKAMNDGLKAERDVLAAKVTELMAADVADQVALDAANASLATVNATLEALTAVASNTPVDTGGSTGGVVG